MFSFSEFFTDPVLRSPTIGSMLMSLSAALIGSLAFVRKRSLIGEALSHATYPGVVLGVMVAGLMFPLTDGIVNIAAMVGGFIGALLGLLLIDKLRAPSDASLCFTLSLFLGMGVLLASRFQLTSAIWYRQIQSFLYGQVATMTSHYIYLYAILTILITLTVVALFQRIKLCYFDPNHAKALGADTRTFRALFHILLILSIVIGIRSVGIVMMSGMLIAPAVAARQWTHRLSVLFGLAGFFGVISAFFGNYLSVQLPRLTGTGVSLATGPMIILSASLIALFSLLFAPRRGYAARHLRMRRFQRKVAREDLLKTLWKFSRDKTVEKAGIKNGKYLPSLQGPGLVERVGNGYKLTRKGMQAAARIVRIHRLWEVYLDRIGLSGDHVHRSAAEMEHIITPEIEETLSKMLGDPKVDPHNQPIPGRGEY